MNLPTLIGSIIIFVPFAAIIGRAFYNRIHHKGGGCGCGCENCPSKGMCHTK